MDSVRFVWGTLWALRTWWLIPMGVVGLLFVLLVLLSDITGDAPFVYTLF